MGKSNAKRDRNSIQSLARGLNILELCARSPLPVTLTEIATQARLTKTTSQRYLNTLCALGFLCRGDGKSYFLNYRVLSFAYGFLNTSNIVKIAKPYLDQLSSELGKTVNLAVLEDVHTLCLYRKEVSRFLKYEHGPGTKLPCYAASLGKVLLAGLSDEELKKRMDKIEFYPITPKTISSKKKLREEIIATRKRGYSISDQELSMDMYSIAVPLLDSQGEVVAAINASLEFSFKDSPNLKNVIKRLIETGEMISNSLGYKGVYPSYGR